MDVALPPFLAPSPVIDFTNPIVATKACELCGDLTDPTAIAEACFLFVRDTIRHSADFQCNPVTCAASDVLRHGTGYCYAKAHLLVALLRACGLPAGLCYQRLLLDPEADQHRFCLHGLAAVLLPQGGWYRIDPRGNKPGVDAQFLPDGPEQLAFTVHPQFGEVDYPHIFAEPDPGVIALLLAPIPTTLDQVLPSLPQGLAS